MPLSPKAMMAIRRLLEKADPVMSDSQIVDMGWMGRNDIGKPMPHTTTRSHLQASDIGGQEILPSTLQRIWDDPAGWVNQDSPVLWRGIRTPDRALASDAAIAGAGRVYVTPSVDGALEYGGMAGHTPGGRRLPVDAGEYADLPLGVGGEHYNVLLRYAPTEDRMFYPADGYERAQKTGNEFIATHWGAGKDRFRQQRREGRPARDIAKDLAFGDMFEQTIPAGTVPDAAYLVQRRRGGNAGLQNPGQDRPIDRAWQLDELLLDLLKQG